VDYMENVKIREVSIKDAPRLLEIYSYYITDTAITFETEIPSLEEFQGRIKNITKRYPYLVFEENGQVMGYSYAHAYYGRKAYDWCVEMSIYLHKDYRGKGAGSLLYKKMQECLKAMNIINLYSCITRTDKDNEYLTNASVRFHEKEGFKEIGRFKACGYKFNHWFDTVWMEKDLGEHKEIPDKVKNFSEIIDKIEL